MLFGLISENVFFLWNEKWQMTVFLDFSFCMSGMIAIDEWHFAFLLCRSNYNTNSGSRTSRNYPIIEDIGDDDLEPFSRSYPSATRPNYTKLPGIGSNSGLHSSGLSAGLSSGVGNTGISAGLSSLLGTSSLPSTSHRCKKCHYFYGDLASFYCECDEH